MAVTLYEMTRSKSQNIQREKRYTRTFLGVSDAPDSPMEDVETALNLALGDAFPEDNDAQLLDVLMTRQSGNAYNFDITLNYTSVGVELLQNDPLNRDPVWGGSYLKELKPRIEDLDGKACVNSAGQPFANPIDRADSYQTITLQVNYEFYNFDCVLKFSPIINHTNAEAWDTEIGYFNSGELLCESITWSIEYENTERYIQANYVFIHNPLGWEQDPILDAGHAELIISGDSGTEASLVAIEDAYGKSYPFPSKLNGNGERLDPDGESVYIYFRWWDSADYEVILP